MSTRGVAFALVGDLTDPSSVSGNPPGEPIDWDYATEPADMPVGLAWILGVASVLVTIISAAALVLLFVRMRPPSWWTSIVVRLAIGSVVLGYYYRVITQGVIGANIGAGLLSFVVWPFLMVLGVSILVTLARVARHDSPDE